jgi:hypothetical protein
MIITTLSGPVESLPEHGLLDQVLLAGHRLREGLRVLSREEIAIGRGQWRLG